LGGSEAAKSENLLFAGLIRVLRQSKLRLKTVKNPTQNQRGLGGSLPLPKTGQAPLALIC
jgi:hypothetical protein